MVDGHFLLPCHCAKDFRKRLSPVISGLSYPLTKCKNLLCALGIKDKFGAIDFVEALERIVPEETEECLACVRDLVECLHGTL